MFDVHIDFQSVSQSSPSSNHSMCMYIYMRKRVHFSFSSLKFREGKKKENLDVFMFLDSMNRPLFRARNLDPSKRIRLLVDQHDDNNNLTNSTTQSSSSNNLLVALASTNATQQSTGSTSQLPQRCVQQMPFVSGMEREEEAVDNISFLIDSGRK